VGTWQPIHIATMLAVTDLDRSVAFYCDRLGFEVREQDSGIALLAQGSTLLYLVPSSDPTPDKPNVTLTCTNTPERTSVNLVFRVRDCQAAYRELTDCGVVFLTEPQSPSWGGWRCFARDPDGYLIEIEEPFRE
jgi:catechol 2,3-dioxygenase-like lactoylglutathione lyase family enzyme